MCVLDAGRGSVRNQMSSHQFDDFTRFSMAPKGLWRRPRTFEGGPLEPLKGPGDLERPPGIILTSPPSPPAAGCGAPLRRFGHRPPLAGRQAGGREPREEPQENPGGPGEGKKTTGDFPCCMKEDLMLESIFQERRVALGRLLR